MDALCRMGEIKCRFYNMSKLGIESFFRGVKVC
jgi:hypothetical protein